ncbi:MULTISPECIES: rod shape-determining protein MreC [unclassified Romboutsia]|uniref:rod shape-determining protein MreC n=1 Tax=unclassified Romboutsia TaxID=2626894 RepID=UPI0008233D58|nr:rod shape-determining protein MreC [Romboutsia sp. Marseille-P6047]SCH34738.1 rod shape-determining protein MreC [uncultured Clostridium sp.]
MIVLKFNNDKKDKKRVNVKVIATTTVAITLIGIVGISIGKYSGNNPFKFGAVLDATSSIESSLNKGFTFITNNFSELINYKKNAKKLEEIEVENEKLKQEIVELNNTLSKGQSLESLKKALNFIPENYKANMISASVVSKNDGNWYTSFVIGAGSKDGVKKDSLVVNGSGLVGVVYEVSENYSKAISLLDTKSSVSFKLLKNSDFKGILTQGANISDGERYKENGYLQGYMFDSSYDVLPGDTLVTSGLGLYPEGIIIGKVDKVIDDKNQSLKYVVVKPYVDFKNIDDVIIIEPRDKTDIG